MATRIYFANSKGTPGITPAVASGWEATAPGFGRYQGILSGTTDSSNDTPTAVGSGSANDDTVTFQLVFGPLAATTLTGTVKGQMAVREANAATDGRAQMTIRVIAPDGTTVRGTPLAFDTAALSSEFNVDTAQRVNRQFPRGGATALTSTAITAGDYLVIEWGFRNHGTNTGAVRMGAGSGSTDLAENETQNAETTNNTLRPWVEFSQTLSPLTMPTPSAATGTGTANNAKPVVSPAPSAATGTGTAYDATISFLSPPRTFVIDSVDYTSKVRLERFSFVEAANRGEVGVGGIAVDDSSNALTIPAMKYAQADEPSAGTSNKRLWSGFTHTRSTNRGPNKVSGQREWDVELVDLNTLADDFVLTASDSADRSAETDYQRIAWLLTSVFGTSGSITAGVVPNSNTVNMEARDYRGQKARDVLAECSEAAGKLWFIYDYGAGRLLYYDLATGTSLSSTLKISDVPADVDNSVTWFPVGAPTVTKNPDRIYSKVHFTYNEGTVTVSNAGTASSYRTREASVMDTSVTDATVATAKANAILSASASEISEVSEIALKLPAANVNDIRAGQRVQIKLTRHDISSFTYFRCIRRQVQPAPGPAGASDVEYLVTLSLASDVLASANGGRGRDDVPQNLSNATDDGASVIVDRNGITVTDGAFTLTDATGQTVMTASGFSGSWSDFIRLGLYNARLLNGNQGGIAPGRTSDLPYWTAVRAVGSPTFVGLAAGGVKITPAALNDYGYLLSDAVPVRPGSAIDAGCSILLNRAAGTLNINSFVLFYQADGSASSTSSATVCDGGDAGFSSSITSLRWITNTITVPTDAVTAKMYIGCQETSSHSASNYVTFYGAKLVDAPITLPPNWQIPRDARADVGSLTGTADDWDPGNATASYIRASLTGAWTLRGLVAPSNGYRLIILQNYNASFSITLKHQNVNSASANRFYLPGGVDYVVPYMGSVLLEYNSLLGAWCVIAG